MSKRYRRNVPKKKHHYSYATGYNHHHIWFQGRHYEGGFARALRSDPFCIILMPRSQHQAIHAKIHDVPRPNGSVCRRVLSEIVFFRNIGDISNDDSPTFRLDFLIKALGDSCPATTAILMWQKQFFQKSTVDLFEDYNFV